MTDKREFQVRVDLRYPTGKKRKAEDIINSLKTLYADAVNINEGTPNEEISFIEIRRSGHRTGTEDTIIARWEVGKGKTI